MPSIRCYAMNKKKAISQHYEPRISSRRASHEILDWASPASQQARFNVLADNVDLRGKSLLDVGCGLGDLWAYLRDRKIDVRYTGVDILEKMVVEARRRHPEATFVQADIFGDAPSESPSPTLPISASSFDVVFCSGAMNLNLGNNLEFLPVAISRMCRLSRHIVAFNLLHVRATAEAHKYFYYDPKDVRRLLTSSSCDVQIIDNYLPNDFTVICRKAKPGAQCGMDK